MGVFSWQWLVTGRGSSGEVGGGDGGKNSILARHQAIGKASVGVVGAQGTQERCRVQQGG